MVKDLVGDNGPSDVIHDLHAKYQAAVNKAERVAEGALQYASKALGEQSKQGHSIRDVQDDTLRFKRDNSNRHNYDEEIEIDEMPEADAVKEGKEKISPAKVDKMIDLMNNLNRQFGK